MYALALILAIAPPAPGSATVQTLDLAALSSPKAQALHGRPLCVVDY